MDNLFLSLRKVMYEYTHVDELTPRRRQAVLNTYARFSNNYEFVDQLVPTPESSDEADADKGSEAK